jgi:hypothetical protein
VTFAGPETSQYVTTLCDNCGAPVFPKKRCRRETHNEDCGRDRHYFPVLPIAVRHYGKGKAALCCGRCATAVLSLDPALVALASRGGRP